MTISLKLKNWIEQYKKLIQGKIPEAKYDEIYKWETVQHFQENWKDDHDASTILENLKKSFNYENNNLWSGSHYLPYKMLLEFAIHDPAAVSEMFNTLFNESQPLNERLAFFTRKAEEIKNDIDPDKEWSTYQHDRALTVYLSLRYPEKYYLYKNRMFNEFCELTEFRDRPGMGKKYDYTILSQYFDMCEKVREELIKDQELIAIHNQRLPNKITFNNNYHLLTQDFIYSVTTYLKYIKHFKNSNKDKGWYNLARVMQSIDNVEIINKYFDIVNSVLEAHDLNSYNEITYAAALQRENRIHLTIGGHYSVSIEKKGSEFSLGLYCALNDYEMLQAKYPQARKINMRTFKGGNIAVWMKIDPLYIEPKDIVDSVISGVHTELKGTISPFRASNANLHNKWIFEAANDQKIRDALMKEDLSNYVEKAETDQVPKAKENPLNIILYGPPGTGKTYNTVNKAVAICNPTFNLDQPRETIKEEFARLLATGQICFTTFHQSMSYEDFIEGLKPSEPDKEGDQVIYKVEDGIFKKSCIDAAISIAKEASSEETERVLDFSLAFDNFVQEIEDRLSSEENIELPTKGGGKVIVDGISQQGNILIKHPGKDNLYPASKQRLSRLHSAFPDLSEVTNIDQQFRSIIGGSNSTANWAVLNAIRNNGNISLQKQQLKEISQQNPEDKKRVVDSLKNEDFVGKTGEPHVLIIDEINRGNVSQIFGELITLIEEDKRAGKAEALEVTLPYSKTQFSIPPNLYIIGTMNTADRSVEALDVALRRRFTFEYKGPDYYLDELQFTIEGTEITLANLLETINDRITFLKDEDHQIGHSYLMNRTTLSSLRQTFYKNIIPLLKEYFYNDYGKIRMVLGDGFVEIKEAYRPNFAADDEEVLDQTVYKIRPESEIDILAAITGLIK